jgi:hypothetical protein
MGCPPSSVGAVHEMVRLVAVLEIKMTFVGAAGVVVGVAVIVLDQLLVPSAVVWATRN